MNLHQLHLFSAVVRCGSFALASRELFISQSALSIQIKRLETSMGLELLRRSRGGVAPTAAGQELFAAATTILQQVTAAERRLHALKTGLAGSIAIGVSHTGALYLLPPIIRAFKREFPEVSVNVLVESAPQIVDLVTSGGIDAGLEWMPSLSSALECRPLLVERFHVVCSAQHPLAATGTITPEEFVQAPYFTVQYPNGAPSHVNTWLVEHHLFPRDVSYLPSIDAVKRMVEADLGITVLAYFSTERELASGHLALLDLPGLSLERTLVMMTRQGDTSLLLQRFVSFVAEHVRAYSARRSAG